MKRTDVFTVQGKDYYRMTRELLEACDLAEDIGDRRRKIGLKPNLVVAEPASGGATTHPELADALISYLKEHGFQNITVMESAWVGASTMEAAEKNGILEVCRRHEVPFADMKKEPGISCRAGGTELHVCGKALEMDYLINLPVVKGHSQTKVTCALKNYKGLIPDAEKRRFHSMGLHRPIACLNAVLRQDFILADNICGDLDFEEGGNPVSMDRILAFKDPVLCDSFAAETLGYRPEEIDYIRLAERLGIGSMNTGDIRLHPVRPEKEREKQAAPKGRVAQLAKYVEQREACSACYGSLIYALDRMERRGLLKGKKDRTISIGQGFREETGALGIGNCTRCFEKSLRGCPPKAVDVVKFLEENWQDS